MRCGIQNTAHVSIYNGGISPFEPDPAGVLLRYNEQKRKDDTRSMKMAKNRDKSK